MAYRDLEHEQCSIARPVALLGDRWTLIVLRQAFTGVRRFEQFQSSLGISRSLLTDRLNRLVEAGILERHAYRGEQRTRFEYRLTEKGRDLYPVLMALRTWGDKYLAPEGPFQVYRHRECGGQAQVTHVCEQCGNELTARDVTVSPGPGQA